MGDLDPLAHLVLLLVLELEQVPELALLFQIRYQTHQLQVQLVRPVLALDV